MFVRVSSSNEDFVHFGAIVNFGFTGLSDYQFSHRDGVPLSFGSSRLVNFSKRLLRGASSLPREAGST